MGMSAAVPLMTLPSSKLSDSNPPMHCSLETRMQSVLLILHPLGHSAGNMVGLDHGGVDAGIRGKGIGP